MYFGNSGKRLNLNQLQDKQTAVYSNQNQKAKVSGSLECLTLPWGAEVENGGTSRNEKSASKSYASVLGQSLNPGNDNNVLEVVLAKDSRGSFSVSDIDCHNLMRRLGLDMRPGVNVIGVQVCPNGRGVIYITLKKEIDVGRYCRYDVLDVSNSGVRAVLVKPAGKREAVVTMKGIHPNIKDEVVLEYLAKFGNVVTKKVVYGLYTEGPLAGLRNGDRSFKMEIKPSTSLGSYHVIRVMVRG